MMNIPSGFRSPRRGHVRAPTAREPQRPCGHWVFTSTIAGYQFFDTNYVNRNRDRHVDRLKIWLEARAQARALAESHGIHPDVKVLDDIKTKPDEAEERALEVLAGQIGR